MGKVIDVLYAYGKITEKQHKAVTEKESAKKAAKDNYKANKAKLNKTELKSLLDILVK